jgi:pyrimidine operon attenuation protein/uracil phosphoribosyltransferase
MSSQILDAYKVQQKISRIALEIIERTYKEEHVIIVGIKNAGYELAIRICKELKRFENKDYPCYHININKPAPLEREVETSLDRDKLPDAVVILVDDVQNSGRTMAYAVRHFLQYKVKSIQTCVLIDRKHNRFPIKADYVGLSLSTTLQEHVLVEESEDGLVVSLN